MIRPSVAFISMSREMPTQSHYVDLYDGPSSLVKRREGGGFAESHIPTLRDLKQELYYETERKMHTQHLKDTI